jgi:polyphosphate kinase
MLDAIGQASAAAKQGKPARIVLKMNALTDEALARALAQASQCGVDVVLIVRGACILPAGVPHITDRVRVRSVIGRFLEHSRVFYFQHGDQESLWLSSADWMNRNMLRRIELAWPVTDPALKQRVIDECLSLYLADERDSWEMKADGVYLRALPALVGKNKNTALQPPLVSAQVVLKQRYGRKPAA